MILSFPHSAALRQGTWTISVLLGATEGENMTWKSLVTLGQETINSPVYAQLDLNMVHLVTETLTAFALVGQSPHHPPAFKSQPSSRSFPRAPTSGFGSCRSTKFRGSPSSISMEPSQPADTNNTKLVRRARDTYTLEIKQNRNNPGPVQLEGTEEMDSQFKKNGRSGEFLQHHENMFHVSFLVNIRLPFYLLQFSTPISR